MLCSLVTSIAFQTTRASVLMTAVDRCMQRSDGQACKMSCEQHCDISLKEDPDLSCNMYFKEQFQIANEAIFCNLESGLLRYPKLCCVSAYMSTVHLRNPKESSLNCCNFVTTALPQKFVVLSTSFVVSTTALQPVHCNKQIGGRVHAVA